MRYTICFLFGFALFFGCGGSTSGAPASVAGTWSIQELDSDCPMFEPDSFTVAQTGRNVSAQFIDGAGNQCSLIGTYEPDRFVGTFRVEEPSEEGRVITLGVDAYARAFGTGRQVDGWLRVESDTAGQCVGDIIEFCAKILGEGPENQPPTLTFFDGDFATTVDPGQPTFIDYRDNDPDSVARTTIYADIDGNLSTTGDQILISERDEENGALQSIRWDTTGVPPGSYRIIAVTTDGTTTITTISFLTYTIRGGGSTNPNLTMQGGPATFCPGGILTIEYADNDVGPTTIYADPDGDLSTTAGQIVIAADRPDGNGAQQTVLWDTAGVPLDTYTIIARASTGLTASRQGTITLVAPSVFEGGEVFASSPSNAFVADVLTLADGSYIVSGNFSGTITLGVGEANETTYTAGDNSDLFLAHYNANGTLRWANRAESITTIGDNHVSSGPLARHTDGSIYMTNTLRGSAIFDEGGPNETTLSATGPNSVLMTKWNADGDLLWARVAGGPGQDQGTGIAVFADGSFVVTGLMGNGDVVFGEGEANETTFTVVNGFDIFVARYDTDGRLVWARQVDSAEGGSDIGIDLIGFADGSCVVSQRRNSRGAIPFTDMWLSRYDADGNVLWERYGGVMNSVGGFRLAGFPDGSFVAVIGGGFFHQDREMTFGLGDPNQTTVRAVDDDDAFINRYNADGTLAWTRQFGGNRFEWAEDVVVLADGSIAVAGRFLTTAQAFGDGYTFDVESNGDWDVFLMHLDGDGNPTCMHTFGGALEERASIAAFPDGSIIMFGFFETSMTLPDGTTLTSVGSTDMFRARFGPVGN